MLRWDGRALSENGQERNLSLDKVCYSLIIQFWNGRISWHTVCSSTRDSRRMGCPFLRCRAGFWTHMPGKYYWQDYSCLPLRERECSWDLGNNLKSSFILFSNVKWSHLQMQQWYLDSLWSKVDWRHWNKDTYCIRQESPRSWAPLFLCSPHHDYLLTRPHWYLRLCSYGNCTLQWNKIFYSSCRLPC